MQLTGTQKSFGLLNWGKLAKDGFFRDDYRSDAGVDVKKAPVHTIAAPENINKQPAPGTAPALQELGIPLTSLTPSLQSVPLTMDADKAILPTNANSSIPAIDSVIIPPTPGLGAPRTSAPPTVIVPTGGSLPSTAPLGIPSAPQATPYR